MALLSRRFAAALCVLALAPGAWAHCGGWSVSAESRRACCQPGGGCHDRDTRHSGAAVDSQAAADSCCATSESDDTSPSPTPFALNVTSGLLQPALPAVVPPARQVAIGRRYLTGNSLLASAIPKHLFLSVFLV
jgi:hypothetical protein